MKRIYTKDSQPAAVKSFDFQMEFKDLSESGTFSGYASIFGNVDLGGDVVERGAFQEMATTKDGKVRILNHHNMRDPIGKATVVQDDRGLKFDGALILENASARNAHALMKAGVLDGMSVGYDILENGSEITNAGIRRLKRLKLWELSVVTFGMNPQAKIDTVKERGRQVTTIREYEDLLRDVGGFSHAQAKLLAVGGWNALQMARDEPKEPGLARDEPAAEQGKQVSSLIDFLKTI